MNAMNSMNSIKTRGLNACLVGAVLFCLVFLSLWPAETEESLLYRLDSTTGAERIGLLLQLSRVTRDSNQALTYGREALELLDRFPDAKLRVSVLLQLCEVCQNLGKIQVSRDYAKQCLEITEKNHYENDQAEALYYFGRSYYQQSIYDRAAAYLSRAEEFYKRLGDQAGVAKTRNTLGMIYLRLGNYPKAMEDLLQALKIYETPGLEGEQTREGLAYTNNNIGFLYYSMGHYNQALEYYLKARAIHESLDNKWGISIVLNNIAEIYREKKEYDKALSYYSQSLQLKEELGYRHGMATTLHNIGKVYEEMQNYPEALDYFKRALTIREEIDDKIGINATLLHVGRINRKTGQTGAALEQVNRAMDIALAANAKTGIRDAYRELSEIIAAAGDYAKALYYYEKYKETDDSIFNETSSKRIAELHTQYRIEKNEKEIALLKKNSELRKLTLKRDKNINLFIISTSVLFIIIVIVLYARWRSQTKMTLVLDREIREHQLTEKKLHESEEKFRRLAEAAKVGIYICRDNSLQYVNPYLLSLFGYSGGELAGRSPLDLVHEKDREMVREKMEQRLSEAGETGDTLRYEFRGITKDGEILYLESYGGATRFQGKPAVLETVIDITHRKKTAEKLLESQKLEAMGILAGGISHDFNNLLVAMVGYLGTLKEKIPKKSPHYEAVENITKAHHQAAELGRLLIDFSWELPRPDGK